jgi:hypothetical protein|tara:strand:+ start:2692 stop:2973 length:282 start_codon:yes stop_codon:yes gene_type:complete
MEDELMQHPVVYVVLTQHRGKYMPHFFSCGTEAEDYYHEYLELMRPNNALLCVLQQGEYFGKKYLSKGLPLELQSNDAAGITLDEMERAQYEK